MIRRSILKICREIEKSGGSCFFVGGYVRDELLGLINSDVDIEVFNIEYDTLKLILKKHKYKEYKKFGVFILEDATFALPRVEFKNGKNHYAFKVEIDPSLSIEKAAERRDFTINAIYKNVLTNEIFDPYGGIEDLENKTLRCITDSFVEDDVRIIRAIRFASMYNLKVDGYTMNLMKQMDIGNISKERLNNELAKMKNAKFKDAGRLITKELQIDEKIRI